MHLSLFYNKNSYHMPPCGGSLFYRAVRTVSLPAEGGGFQFSRTKTERRKESAEQRLRCYCISMHIARAPSVIRFLRNTHDSFSLRLGHARGKTTFSCFLTRSRRFATRGEGKWTPLRYPAKGGFHIDLYSHLIPS